MRDQSRHTAAPNPDSVRALRLLAVGAAAGLTLAAVSLLDVEDAPGRLPPGAIARVNGVPIAREDYQRLLSGVAGDSRNPVSEATRQRVLDRMIEEELLVQHALDLGLAQLDRRVRADLTGAVIASIVSGADAREASPQALQRFFEANRDFFRGTERLAVRQIFFRIPQPAAESGARARAAEASRRLLSGEPFEAVRKDLGDREIAPLPEAPLPPAKLREYLGPTALRAARSLQVGATSEVIRSGTGLHLLQVLDREAPRAPEFEDVRPQVRAEWRRRAGDEALRAYLDDLRAAAAITIAPSVP